METFPPHTSSLDGDNNVSMVHTKSQDKIKDVFHRTCRLKVGHLDTRILDGKRLCGSEVIRHVGGRKVHLELSCTAILHVVLEIPGHQMTGGWESILEKLGYICSVLQVFAVSHCQRKIPSWKNCNLVQPGSHISV